MIVEHLPQMSFDGYPHADDAIGCQKCHRQMFKAEREMGAFVTAVRTLYGTHEASLAANDWIELAESKATLLVDGYPNWRSLTIAAANLLADRRFSLARTPE